MRGLHPGFSGSGLLNKKLSNRVNPLTIHMVKHMKLRKVVLDGFRTIFFTGSKTDEVDETAIDAVE